MVASSPRKTLLALILIAPTALGQDVSLSADERFERFELWDSCRAMNMLVEELSRDSSEIGLTKQDIEIAVRSRLRSARMYSDDSISYLYVAVNIVAQAFDISFFYRKVVRDLSSGETLPATTWQIGSTGNHGQSSEYILSAISQHTDRFIDEYLRVNEEACS